MTASSPRALAKRQQMLTAARQLFLTHGYAGTTTDTVARAAGVSKQTLYVYFPGKVDLLAAVAAQELAELEPERADQHFPESLPELREALVQLAVTVTGQLMTADALALLRLLVGEAVHLPELRGVLRRAFPARILSGAGALLAAAHRAGLIHAPQADLSARMFVGPIMSYVALDGLFGDALPAPPSPATLRQLVDLFLLTVSTGGSDAQPG